MSFCTEQESIYHNIGIIGCGASGGLLSILLSKNPQLNVSAFDLTSPFSSLLPTGGGRCNITYDELDIREFVKNYPRGEKFLLSVFSRFNCDDTTKLFADLGIKTYIQDDKRVFPVSDSAEKTVEILNKHLKSPRFNFVKNKVISVKKGGKYFKVITEKKEYEFDAVIIATGGRGNGFELAKKLGHNIIHVVPSLCSFDIKERYLYSLSGMSFKDCEISYKAGKKFKSVIGDIMFTHKSITGPGIFKVSALNAYTEFSANNPLVLNINLSGVSSEDIEKYIIQNPKKNIKNVFSKFMPENFVVKVCAECGIDPLKQVAQIRKEEKNILIKAITDLTVNVIEKTAGSEIVSAGGVDLKEINSKTMESKIVPGLFFTGEVLNIDGFTGGFNLQNAWATAFVCSENFG